MPPVIPTPFPIPTPEILSDTLDVTVFWQWENISPAISMAQSVFLWVNYYNILIYIIILMTVVIIVRWMIQKVSNPKNGVDDV
jgi:hypothetical protein